MFIAFSLLGYGTMQNCNSLLTINGHHIVDVLSPMQYSIITQQTPAPRSCVPCGKLAYPRKTQPQRHMVIAKKIRPFQELLKNDAEAAIRHEVENRAEARKFVDNANFKLHLCKEQMFMNLEKRRDKLKQILEDEDECYQDEIKRAFEERKTERISEMRTRVQQLKSQREVHEKKFVEAKYDQAFQNQCEQMRTLLSKRMSREIKLDWNAQLEEKRRLDCEAQEEERFWAYLNNKDVEEKWKREQAYDCVRAEASRRGIEELDKQLELKKARAAAVTKIKARELAIIDEDRAAMEAEKAKHIADKEARFLRAKAHVKDMIETRDYYRDRKLKREVIVAQEFLKKAVRELYIEQEDRNKAKRELKRAIEVYTDYLKKRDCLANEREDALQRIIDGVIEEQYEKVMAGRTRERAQRRKLFENVMAGRKHQIEDLKKKDELEEAEKQQELIALKEDWKRYLEDMEAEKRAAQMKQAQYRCDLDSQVEYGQVIKERQSAEIKREDDMCEIEERLFNHRLQTTLQEAELTMSNPYRQPLVGKCVKQCLGPVPNVQSLNSRQR